MTQTRWGFVRQKGLLGASVIAVVASLLLLFVGSIALGEQASVVPIVGLWMVEIVSGCVIVAWVVLTLQTERNGGLLQLVRTSAPTMAPYVIGKWGGYSVIALLVLILMSGGLGVTLWLSGTGWQRVYGLSLLMSSIKIGVIIALVVMLSSVVRPMLLIMSTLVIVVASHMAPMIMYYFTQASPHPVMAWVSRGLYYLLPSFADMSIYEYVANPVAGPYTGAHISMMIGSGVIYIVVFLFLGILGYTRGALAHDRSSW